MLPEEVTKMIGKVDEPRIMEVEKGAIKRFADAVGDGNPLYWDEEYARNTHFGGIIAPPGFFGWPARWNGGMPLFSRIGEELVKALRKAGYKHLLDRGIEFEFYQSVRAGDILVSSSKIAYIYERESKGGMLIFSLTETIYTKQHGALVAIVRQTLISY